ncbi:MAG: transglutaminase-like domain-containing protein [Burkholderiales bacterium]
MKRRDFLVTASLAPAGLLLPRHVLADMPIRADRPWRIFETTTRVEVLKPVGATKVWLPMPMINDTDYQKTLGSQWSSEGGKIQTVNIPIQNAGIVAAEWADGAKPMMELKSRFATRDRTTDFTGRNNVANDEVKYYLQPSEFLPTDGIVKTTADKITQGINGDVEKARAIYEWIIDSTFRDPKTRGCGLGDVKYMLETNSMGGKCADINALFVALARASGVPARDVYGVRVADSNNGYKSLGKSGTITKAQHCRAEFFAAGLGWVPVDPADVRKVVLEEAGGLPITHEKVIAARKFLFGNWEMNWLAYNTAHDIKLPGSDKKPIAFFMYPQCETAEGRRDCLDPDNFKYEMTSREIVA